MRQIIALLLVGAALAGPVAAQSGGDIRVLIGLDPSDSEGLLVNGTALAATLGNAAGRTVKVTKSDDLGNAMRASRTGEVDVFVAPAHVVASAMAHGYDLVGSTSRDEAYVLVGRADAKTPADLKGGKIYLTQQDSVAAYVARGMLNEAGQSLKIFDEVMFRKTSGAGLFALAAGIVDATCAKRSEADEWAKQNPGKGTVLLTSKAVPGGLSVAVRRSLAEPARSRLIAWFVAPNSVMPGLGRVAFEPDSANYRYVAALGHFTPAQLPGVTRVGAKEVDDLLKRGVTFVDVRSEREYAERHVKGAILIPYVEKSLKDVAFDPSADTFAGLDKLDRTKPVIFACNGPECWKSYKASKVAAGKGFKTVYWFRGGLPEWMSQGLPVEQGT